MWVAPAEAEVPPQRKVSEEERQHIRAVHRDWVRYIVLCGAFGVALGVAAAALVVQLDISGIGSMLENSPNALGYKLLLAGGLASTFGQVSMAIGILIRSRYFGGD